MSVLRFINKYTRIVLAIIIAMLFTTIFIAVCILFLPWRKLRIQLCNIYGSYIGTTLLFLLNANLSVTHKERIGENYPAIYIGNHTSTLDIPIGISLCPIGGVGISKKELAYIPFFGWLYLLSGHLLIDRKNREAAIRSMDHIARLVKKHNLSIWIWPEGTRSKDGRLQPFKKGFVHLALSTQLPIVPVIIHNAHNKWGKQTGLNITPGKIKVDVLPKIDTTHWKAETVDEHAIEIYKTFSQNLTQEQKPQSG